MSETFSSAGYPNPHLGKTEYLYHLGFDTDDKVVERMHDVKFICLGGKIKRMKMFAQLLYEELGHPENSEFEDMEQPEKNRVLKNLSEGAGRYALYKVGSVISASHGIGTASLSVVLHELLKLIQYAKCQDVTLIRIGTSGGLGVEPGTVVITDTAYNGLLQPGFRMNSCGKEIVYPAKADENLRKKLLDCAQQIGIKAETGNTMKADDFYEEQARLDGAFCTFTEKDKMDFLKRAYKDCGIVNIEMEATGILGLCHRANIKAAVVCVTLVNRLLGDVVTEDTELVKKWESFPQKVVAELIKKQK